jgi:Uma2 family endonuclease
MATVLKLGRADHGRPLSLEEFQAGDYEEGYRYDLIDGVLYVSPQPNVPQGFLEHWIFLKLQRYADAHPEVINFVYTKCRVFVPGRPGVTNPEPDVAAYHDFPVGLDLRDLRWQDVSPLLVVEVVSDDDPDKDLVRNAELYHQVPSIKEYWIVDPRHDPNRPTLLVHRRHGKKWRINEYQYGEAYSTRMLPGFELIVNPRT